MSRCACGPEYGADACLGPIRTLTIEIAFLYRVMKSIFIATE